MNKILLSIAVFCFLGVNAQKAIDTQFSLNGDWKFYAIEGQGSNSLQVKEEPTDIIVDNADADFVEIKGKWNLKKVGTKGATFYKADFLQRVFRVGDTGDNYVRFRPKISKKGNYEAFVRFPFETNLTTQFTVQHADGEVATYANQRSCGDQWISLGIYTFNASKDNFVEISAIDEGGVSADAVLFRPISDAVFSNAKNLPNQVYLPQFNDSKWNRLKVPGHWGMLNNFSNYVGKGWYRKTFNFPANWKINPNEQVRLQFEAVYHVAKVYLNGKFVGEHQGGFSPFELDITDKVLAGKPNVLAVEVDNNFLVGATWNWGGIIREVAIVKNKAVRITQQYIHAEPNLKTGTALLKLRLRVENNSGVTQNIQINSAILDIKKVAEMTGNLAVLAHSIQEINLETTLKPEDVKLWHFDLPNLYQIQTTIRENKQQLDNQTNTFGIRKIEINDSQLFLNGEPIRLGGFNRVSEHRFWGSSEPQELLEQDMKLMKEAGSNFMRIMHGTQNERLIDLCDKMGILLFEEVNVRELSNPEFNAPIFDPYPKEWIKAMVNRDINHPSIIGWSVGNELKNHFDYGRKMMEYVKTELDPYRLVTCVSNSGQKDSATPETDPNTFADIIMHNMYQWQGKPQEILEIIRKKWPNKPIFISEYGFDPFQTPSLDEDKEILSDWHDTFRNKNPFVIGTSLWTFNDYRSGYAGTSDEENRVWGVINSWRQKRRLFDRVKKELSPVKDIQVEGIDFDKKEAQVIVPIRGLADYPIFSLKGYTLVWIFKDANGLIISKNEMILPTIHPQDGLWKGTIQWTNLKTNPMSLTVNLENSIGINRFEKTLSFQVPNPPAIKEIITGNQSVRVLFDKVAGATEYQISYLNSANHLVKTPKTIADYIDVPQLVNNQSVSLTLTAFNDKGESKPSIKVIATPNGIALPPLVYDAFIADQKLVIGYATTKDELKYKVRYGATEKLLNKNFVTNVKGMLSIDLKAEKVICFQIKSVLKTGESNWSNVIKAKK
ncbi:hypothetical protein FFWV33_14645 [Flavobacterium faecale]|uniref:Glycoside hydrolase family 2 n=1 Tax=Flavobacterium faecale TaxID=1355330 RepID=A0A2S1LG18_9FLAO|nr:glycoside hydrolase family 2 TIM barrel-domain containing protein [Flavobacterium faecale]AWG22677.1 hypothetical protein FFWV33_14645 [Flavobacterium faecale]